MLKLRDIMTCDVLTVTPDTSLRDAMDLLARRHVSGAPVLDGGRVVGVVSTTDLLGFAATSPGAPTERPLQAEWGDWDERSAATEAEAEDEPPGSYFTELWADVGEDVTQRMTEVEGPEWNVLDEHTVDEVMTRKLWALPPDESVAHAAELMAKASVHRVVVMDGDTLAGVVSALDLAKMVAAQHTARTYVFNREHEFDDRGWE